MDNLGVITLLYVGGVILLVAEVFIPSHGLLTIGSLACFGVAIYQTFLRDTTAGIVLTLICLALIPSVFIAGIKYIRYLPMGDRLAPPNPSAAETGIAYDRSEYEACVGRTGRAVTPLHPIGVCEFDGRRVQCVAESGMIEAGAQVVGIDMRLNNLAVRPLSPSGKA